MLQGSIHRLGPSPAPAPAAHCTASRSTRQLPRQHVHAPEARVTLPAYLVPRNAPRVPPPFFLDIASNSYSSYEDEYRAMLDEQAVSLQHEADRLHEIMERLKSCSNLQAKVAFLDGHYAVERLKTYASLERTWEVVKTMSQHEQFVIKCLPVIGQLHVLMLQPEGPALRPALERLAGALCRVDIFYDSMGGLVGYQLKSLQLILAGNAEQQAHNSHPVEAATAATPATADGGGGEAGPQRPADETTYHVPPGLDISGEAGRQLGVKAAAQGLLALPYMAEILPVGGAGDRLGLVCEDTGESLPSAMLPFMGRTMLEGIIRDCQAREYLYWHLTGTQVTTPVAIMTSDAKGNHSRISELMEHRAWFGRGAHSFKLFRQPMVPVVAAEDGRWLVTGPLKLMMKPGGHGAIWKLMHDEGIFDWFSQTGRASALIRQISNPMAGVDTTLLSLAGTGFSQRRAFGFMSCERAIGAAEGMNVLQEKKSWQPDPNSPEGGAWEYDYAITNVEYTEFERLGITDQPVAEGSSHSAFPANTNILYVGLQAVRQAVEAAIASGGQDVLPGLIFNLKKKVKYFDPILQEVRESQAGRMECTMQNLADSLGTRTREPLASASPNNSADSASDSESAGSASANSASDSANSAALTEQLSTFFVYNSRNKVTSSAKKKLLPGSTRIAQTPEGAFYDLHRNGWQVLQRCGMRSVPDVATVSQYLEQGPSFLFLFHPALGPLWDVVAQKIRGGSLEPGSELVLEIAEARLVDVEVGGSLLVVAGNVMGHMVPVDQQQPQHAPLVVSNGSTAPPASSSSSSSGPGPELDLYRSSSNMAQARLQELHKRRQQEVAAAATSTGSNSIRSSSRSSSATPPDALPTLDGKARPAGDVKLAYSSQCGRVHLTNVKVQNVGVDWHLSGSGAWKHQVQRHETCRVVLHGRSEFEAYDCRILGNQVFEVPDGWRMVVTEGPCGTLSRHLSPLRGDTPTWEWKYSMDVEGQVGLQYMRYSPLEDVWSTMLGQEELAGEGVLDFTI